MKRHLHPLDSFTRLLDCATTNRPPCAEDQFRFQWFGLFYQSPKQDAFTLRLRLPGGRLKLFQLSGLAKVIQRHASGQILLNAQGGLDIPGVPITSAVEVLHEVESLGLCARRTGGDCVQAVRGGEFDALASTEHAPPLYPLICALEQALDNGLYTDLPRPCEIVFHADAGTFTDRDLSGDTLNFCLARETENCRGAKVGLGQPPFLLLIPGKPETGFLLGCDRIVLCCLNLLKGWATGADRTQRAGAGIGRFLTGLTPETISAWSGGSEFPVPAGSRSSARSQTAGQPTGLTLPGGRLLSGQLSNLAQFCRDQHWQEIRVTNGQINPVGVDGRILEAGSATAKALWH